MFIIIMNIFFIKVIYAKPANTRYSYFYNHFFFLLLFSKLYYCIIYKYQQKQNAYFKDIETLKSSHENTLLQSQLEIQEQTFQNISREIHDNIGQKLTLAKLYLNTLDFTDTDKSRLQVNNSVTIIGEAINDLSDLSHSMSSEIILTHGLINALQFEAAQLQKTGIYKISFSATGNPVFMDYNTELMLFRIVQESLNNIVKHAAASEIDINLHYMDALLIIEIKDNGKGFLSLQDWPGTGLKNIKKRTSILKGKLIINSTHDTGTQIKVEIPLYENNKSL
ncbi:MAG: sensor histidine kinase [Chitinophagaceae bacterium]|nr:sensor histidine kinase [Chitinophagaceae bacterium]